MNPTTALIAEDEPVLADALQRLLSQVWPELTISAIARDGLQACAQGLACLPDVVFLDIHMPGIQGMEVAERLVEGWPAERALPLFVFITAYEQYALQAFEQAAIDYVLKPVQADRLALACQRAQSQLALLQAQSAVRLSGRATLDEATLAALSALQRQVMPRLPVLQVLQAAAGASVYVVPVDEVIYFEAADKYVRVVTAQHDATRPELLLRLPLAELQARLDPDRFWKIHRGCVVNVRAIERVSRQQRRLCVHLRGRQETLDVSRMYEPLFKAM
jgi:DNA-binding LytR/AlgR family response regulator